MTLQDWNRGGFDWNYDMVVLLEIHYLDVRIIICNVNNGVILAALRIKFIRVRMHLK